MYTKLIDTVSNIVNTYGIGILSDNKFWSILTDSYNFSSDYTLRDEFKKCIANGNVSTIISLRGNKKNTLKFIKSIVNNNYHQRGSKETTACLFSIAISIGSCDISDYNNLLGNKSQTPTPKPNPKPQTKPQSRPSNYPSQNIYAEFSVWVIIIWGVISLIGSTALYGWFLLGGAEMFWILCLIAIIQLGTIKGLDVFLHNVVNNTNKSRVIICYLPIIVGYILNSIIPLILCSDSISDALYNYFSADFIPKTYYVVPIERAWYAPRISNSVGFFGGLASICLFISIISCSYRIYSYFKDSGLRITKFDIYATIIISIVICCLYTLIAAIPQYSIYKQQKEFDKLESNNVALRNSRDAITQELSVKGIKLGISKETAWGYLSSMKEDGEPSHLHYNETIKHPDAIYDEFIGTSYFGVFPYEVRPDDFQGVIISGDDYRTLISLDNTTVGLDLYIYNDVVAAMRIYGLGSYNNSLTNFDSLLTLYTSKYGEPEIIKDYSRDKDIHSITPYRSKGKSDRYVWNYKNGRIEMSEFGIMYISDMLLTKVKNECDRGLREYELSKRRKKEQDRIQKEQNDSLIREQKRKDSIQHTLNHQNAINEI